MASTKAATIGLKEWFAWAGKEIQRGVADKNSGPLASVALSALPALSPIKDLKQEEVTGKDMLAAFASMQAPPLLKDAGIHAGAVSDLVYYAWSQCAEMFGQDAQAPIVEYSDISGLHDVLQARLKLLLNHKFGMNLSDEERENLKAVYETYCSTEITEPERRKIQELAYRAMRPETELAA